jgi:hypothetical protein
VRSAWVISGRVKLHEGESALTLKADILETDSHAARCWALASEITNPVLKESLNDAAQRWAALAAELETIHLLLEALEEPEKRTRLAR